MQVYIGLDGGGSGTRAQAEAQDGTRSEIVTGGPANYATDPEGCMREVAVLLARLSDMARAHWPDTTIWTTVGLAGVGEVGGQAEIQAALDFPNLEICGDLELMLSGAFGAGDGLLVGIGTGSVFARQSAGRVTRLGGYGLALGDQASGAWIGREALRQTALAHDGLGVSGALSEAVLSEFGSIAAMIGFARQARPAQFAAFAPQVLEHARQGCPCARAILDAAAGYCLRAIRLLQAGERDLPIVPQGNLAPALLGYLQGQGMALSISAAQGTALDGALLRARARAQL